MDLLNLATNLLGEKLSDIDSQSGISALQSLVGDDEGNLDINSLVETVSSGGLSETLGSWLGDGENQSISVEQVSDLFGSEKISQFAETLNISPDSAADTIASILPSIIDQSSSGGSILDSVGGIGGVINMVKKFF